jgi:hypothetical protein
MGTVCEQQQACKKDGVDMDCMILLLILKHRQAGQAGTAVCCCPALQIVSRSFRTDAQNFRNVSKRNEIKQKKRFVLPCLSCLPHCATQCCLAAARIMLSQQRQD